VQVNFDAEIRLDIGPFIASINKAQSEVAKLSDQLDALNKKTVSPTVSVSGGSGAQSGSSARAAAATQEIQLQKQAEQIDKQRYNQARATQKQQEDHAKNQEKNLARERYALYDVAAAYTAVATAAGAAVVAMAGTAIDFEKSFSDVQRTTENFFTSAKIGEAARAAKNDLKSLASEIPVAFGAITEIATIGNQLGIAQGAIKSFTETVAKFSAATGVGTEQVAMSFGRIGELLNVPAAEFENLGSSIAFAGVNAVATEAQILSVTKEIATTAKMAKFSTPDVVGLSTALSSLGIAPEAARGSVIRTFAGINKAISENGERLEQYANIAGMPAEVFANTWKQNGQVAFDAFLAGLQGLSDQGESLDTVLRNLGMVNVRDIQAVQKLGDNYSVYASSIQDANKGFEEGAFLADAYSIIQETVAAKLALVSNNFANLLDTFGQTAVGDFFKGILDSVNDLLVRLNYFAKSPVGQAFGFLAMLAGVLVTAIAAVNATSALAQASLRAFATAQIALIGTTSVTTKKVKGMNAELVATGTAGKTAALGLQKGKIALNALNTAFTAIKWLAIISAVVAALEALGNQFTSVEQKAENILGGFSGLQDALTADVDALGIALQETGGDMEAAKTATGVIAELTTSVENNNAEINKTIEAHNLLNEYLGITGENSSTLSTEMEDLTFVIGANTLAWLKNAIAQSDAFQDLAKNKTGLEAIIDAGFNVEEALAAAASGQSDAYFNRLTESLLQNATGFDQWLIETQQMDDVIRQSTESMGPLGDGLYGLWKILRVVTDAIPNFASWLGGLFGIDVTPISKGLNATRDATIGVVSQSLILGPLMTKTAEAIAGAGTKSEKTEKDLGNLGKTMRTVVDYANDLRGIFSRAFEIRFGQQQSLDDIAKGWNRISDEAERAREAVADANAEINELTIDRSILEYQLGVAERYKDERRAASIRARLAKIDGSMAKATEKLADNTAKLSKETDGSSKEAIENRAAILGQLGAYTDLIEMYAKTGYKGEELEKKVDELKESFIEQALQAGYSREELEPYIKTFDDLREAIEITPRNVDIEFDSNVSVAQQAVNEYIAKLNSVSREINTNFTTSGGVNANAARIQALLAMVASLNQSIQRGELDTTGRRWTYAALFEINKELKALGHPGFAKGGYVTGPGTGTSDSIPAMLSKGEYVVRASAVGAYGVDFMNALNQQKVGTFTSSGSSQQSSNASSVIYLSPEDRALLRAAIDRPVNLYTENSKIASSANAGNVMLAQRGAR